MTLAFLGTEKEQNISKGTFIPTAWGKTKQQRKLWSEAWSLVALNDNTAVSRLNAHEIISKPSPAFFSYSPPLSLNLHEIKEMIVKI